MKKKIEIKSKDGSRFYSFDYEKDEKISCLDFVCEYGINKLRTNFYSLYFNKKIQSNRVRKLQLKNTLSSI
jgi:hypothetical protein